MTKLDSANGEKESTWTKRFIVAAIVQGAVIVGFTVFLVLSQISILKPEISRVIAAGGAGTWFTFGYTMYIVVGVIGVAVSAVFYYYLENVRKAYYHSTISKTLAWTHLILMNIGTSAAMGLMMLVGYLGGASMLPVGVGGKGFNAGQAHEILAPYVEPISAAILVLAAGVLAGGIAFLITYRSKRSSTSTEEKQSVPQSQ
jgi:putative flippase GtrA